MTTQSNRRSLRAVLIALTFTPSVAFGATLQVGSGKTYAKPCAAFAAAAAGDTVEIDAGTYTSDACNVGAGKDNLTIRGVGGRAKMDATGSRSRTARRSGSSTATR